MISDVNKLAELVQLDSLPFWVREEIELKKEDILWQLQATGSYVIQGPDGKQLTIKTKAKAISA